MEEDRQMCVEAGMDFYLTKPFSADELLALVEQGKPKSDRPFVVYV